MKKFLFLASSLLCLCGQAESQSIKTVIKKIPAVNPKDKVEIMVMGSTHFGQEPYYKNAPKADLFSEARQKEVAEINKLLSRYKPDMIMIETTPEEQASVDSLYTLFKTDKVQLKDIPYGRAERYQFGYNLAKQLNHDKIYGVDYYESVSNRMLNKGDNIDYYLNALTDFNTVVKEIDTGYREGKVSLKDFITFMNAPEVIDMTYQLIYLTPAKVRNASFTNPPVQYIDTAYVNKQYIGAEFVSSFYEREVKIYSNIVTAQIANKGKRLLVIMGQRHGASLPKIIANDPNFIIVPVSKYLK